MKIIFALIASTLGTMSILAAPIIPTENGMTWQYILTEEAGEGLAFSNVQTDDDEKVRLPVVYRIDGKQNVDGRDLLKFEMHRAGMVTNTDLLMVDDYRIVCFARIDQAGELIRLKPAQIMIAPLMEEGSTWNYDAEIAGTKVHQHFAVIDEQDVDVPAGKFHAFKIHGEQTSPGSVVIDRWFVDGVGIVKDVTTTRNADGGTVKRVILELKERPKVAPRPEVKSKKLFGSVGREAIGSGTTQFGPEIEKIYARWQGNGLRKEAKIRVVWIAENIPDIAPPDYTIDEATTTATGPDSHGIFTLSRPEDGWASGDYRVDFYVDDVLSDAVKLKIAK